MPKYLLETRHVTVPELWHFVPATIEINSWDLAIFLAYKIIGWSNLFAWHTENVRVKLLHYFFPGLE